MQGVPIVDKKEKGGAYGKATKDAVRGEAGILCKGKSIGKGEEIEESGEERGSACG